MKKILIVLGGVLAALAAGTALLLLSYRSGRRSIVVPHGRAVVLDPALASQPNAADVYEQALPLAQSISKEETAAIKAAVIRPWNDPDGSLTALLRREAPLLALARRAAVMPRFELAAGLPRIDRNTPLPQTVGAVAGAKLILLDGRRLQAAGQAGEAMDDALTALAIAGQFEREKNFALIDQLVATILVRSAYPLASDLLAAGVDEPRLLLLRAALQPLADTSNVGRGVRQELSMIGANLAEVLMQAWYLPPSTLRKLVLDASRAYDSFADAVAEGARRNDPGIQKSETAARRTHGERPDSRENFFFCLKIGLAKPSEYGDCMIGYPFISPTPDYAPVIAGIHYAHAEAAVLLAAAGVRLYELARRAPPARLRDLVPSFLPQVPADDFDGFRPLSYVLRQDAWAVYGVGPDRKDDGGIPRPEIENEDLMKPLSGDVVVTAARLRQAAPRRRSRGR
ncbi:MAG: hypothetical protein ACHQ49_00290 [Elusimicrobiota bacterium]